MKDLIKLRDNQCRGQRIQEQSKNRLLMKMQYRFLSVQKTKSYNGHNSELEANLPLYRHHQHKHKMSLEKKSNNHLFKMVKKSVATILDKRNLVT